jgi:dTDP-4-amino-4,6-dideoxygalactose transaminase
VLIPAFTFAAVPSAVVHANCQPVLVEVGENYRIDIADFEAKLDDDISAVIISHMRGHTSDMDAIMALCDARGIPVIEDAAHSLGTLWHGRKIGTIGRHRLLLVPVLQAGERGRRRDPDHRRRRPRGPRRDHVGRLRAQLEEAQGRGQNDPALAEAFARWQNMLPLYNMRMQNLSAAVIRPQLPEVARRVRDGRANHDYVAGTAQHLALDERARPARPEERAPDSIQFNLIGMDERRPRPRLRRCRRRARRQGAGLRPVDRQRARLLELELHSRRAPDLPQTRAMLMRACDVRLPARLQKAGPRFHRRCADRGGRGCDGGGDAGLRHLTPGLTSC